jgi:hypothetical protein
VKIYKKLSIIIGSISSTFYARIFHTKVLCTALHSFAQLFSGYILALYFVWHKNIGKTVVRKMLMKLTPGCFSVPVLLVILS